MNEIAKNSAVERLRDAIIKESLTKAGAGRIIGLAPPQISYLFNKSYWKKLSEKDWEKLLKWVNSGYTLLQYSKHHHEAELAPLCIKDDSPRDEMITEVDFEERPAEEPGFKAEAFVAIDWIQTVSSKVITSSGATYHYIPFWFKEMPNKMVEIISFDQLPEELTNAIKQLIIKTKLK